MTDNEKLIESVRDWPTITRMSHSTQLEKLVELRDALEAAGKAHTPTDDEREALIENARRAAGALEEYEFEGVAGDASGLLNRLADLAAGFRRSEVPESSAEAQALVDAVQEAMDRYSETANLDGGDSPISWVPVIRIEEAIDSIPLPFVPPAPQPQGEPSDAQVLRGLIAYWEGADTDALQDYGETTEARMRAALRAASAVTEQGEGKSDV